MILTALVHLYEELCKQGKIQAEGWGVAKVTHRILLDKEGHLGKTKYSPVEDTQGDSEPEWQRTGGFASDGGQFIQSRAAEYKVS